MLPRYETPMYVFSIQQYVPFDAEYLDFRYRVG